MLLRMFKTLATVRVLCGIESTIGTSKIPCSVLENVCRQILTDLLRVAVWEIRQNRELQRGLRDLALIVANIR